MKKLKELGGSFREAKTDDAGKKSYPVVIISQGMGNLADRNYYTKEAIESGPDVYEGKQAYFDHPTPDDEKQRPGRSVKELCGHYENCKVAKDKDGLSILTADFVPMKNSEVIDLIEHEIDFRKKYKDDKHFVGISINGDGEGSQMDYDEFVKTVAPSKLEMEKIQQVEGQKVNVITKFTTAISADFVTSAGAKGRILKEHNLLIKRRRDMSMLEEMKKFIFGAAEGDQKKIKAATKALLEASEDEDEGKHKAKHKKEDEDEGKKEADAKEAAEKAHHEKAKAIMAHMDQCKKEMKQHEDESAKEYEARCMAAAMKKHEAESEEEESEDESKESEDESKKEGDDQKPDPKDKSKDGKKDDGDDDEDDTAEDEKKEDDGGDADDADHADAPKDKKLVKKMVKPDALQKEVEALKKEIEALKASKKESEDEASETKKESAKAKVELAAKDRMILVESVLSKSGLSRAVTEGAELRDLLLKAKNKEEMTKLMKTYKDVWEAGIKESFTQVSAFGFPEMTGHDDSGSNDTLFK